MPNLARQASTRAAPASRARGKADLHPAYVARPASAAILRPLQFSILAAFHLGWRELNVGAWLARVQTKEYTLRATDWVRAVAGVQSLLSLYLLAMWALTYFGRPFGQVADPPPLGPLGGSSIRDRAVGRAVDRRAAVLGHPTAERVVQLGPKGAQAREAAQAVDLARAGSAREPASAMAPGAVRVQSVRRLAACHLKQGSRLGASRALIADGLNFFEVVRIGHRAAGD